MSSIIKYLEKDTANKDICDKVKEDYACFNAWEPQTYGMLAERGLIKGCYYAAIDGLKQISRQGATKVIQKSSTYFRNNLK